MKTKEQGTLRGECCSTVVLTVLIQVTWNEWSGIPKGLSMDDANIAVFARL